MGAINRLWSRPSVKSVQSAAKKLSADRDLSPRRWSLNRLNCDSVAAFKRPPQSCSWESYHPGLASAEASRHFSLHHRRDLYGRKETGDGAED